MGAEKWKRFWANGNGEDSTYKMLLPFTYRCLLIRDLHMFAVVFIAVVS